MWMGAQSSSGQIDDTSHPSCICEFFTKRKRAPSVEGGGAPGKECEQSVFIVFEWTDGDVVDKIRAHGTQTMNAIDVREYAR